MRIRPLPLVALLAACDRDKGAADSASSGLPDGVSLLKSEKAYDTDPDVTADELAALVRGDTAFALDIYQQVGKGQAEDLFFSPYSMSTALAMAWAGARGATEGQMGAALRFPFDQELLHPAMNGLALTLDDHAAAGAEEPFTLHVLNALWGQEDLPYQTPWLDVLAERYDAGVYLLDLQGDPDGAQGRINEAVGDATDGKIAELLPAGSVTENTALVLTNAILFKASWLVPFDEASTRDGAFTTVDGAVRTVPMMHATDLQQPYARGDGYMAIELPYDGMAFSMLIIAPDAGSFKLFDRGLDADLFTDIRLSLRSTLVSVALPRWVSSSAFSLKDALTGLGMTDAFVDGGADFTGILEGGGVHVGDVLHQAVISVDEAGTEAAAATAVEIDTDTDVVGGEATPVVIDRPFVYAILDRPTGAVLFLGRVMDPG